MISIFIDSNILYKDYFFENKSNKKLMEYCEEGLLKIYMSDVVRLELRRQYEHELKDKNQQLKRINKDSERLKVKDYLMPIDVVKQLEYFDKFYDQLSRISDFEILPAKNEFLTDIINRAVNRIKPFKEEKSELKDAIIWKTYSEHVEVNEISDCILLTNNSSDFCDKKDKSLVHPDLMKDTSRFKVVNQAFDFIKEYASTLENPQNKFLAFVNQLEIDDAFVLDIVRQNFEKTITEQVHDKVDNLHPSDILNDDYIMDGQLIPYNVEISDCEDIQFEITGEIALISGIMHVCCETEIWEYNAVRDPGEDRYSTVGEVYINYKVYFNFDLTWDEAVSDLEITDFEVNDIT
ncbi:MAG: PIN domain-containing protein [Marinoscillum sp.]